MRQDEKMRDLVERLAAMSPEPPPYPEEVQIARHHTKQRSRPALVFVGAAALVAALAVPLLLVDNQGDPDPAVTTTVAPVPSTTVSPATTTTVGPTTSTVPVGAAWEGTVYLFQTPQDSNLGNPALVPVDLELTGVAADAPFTAALSAIGAGMPELPAQASLNNAVPPGVEIVSIEEGTVDGTEVWVADMSGEFVDGAGGLLADITMINQLVYTITRAGGPASVLFTVDGEPVEAFGSEGLSLADPVSRETFIDDLAPIFLTDPLLSTESVWLVSGRANTFEAALTVRVLDGEGAVVHEEPVMATCGSGCWGEFAVGIDNDLVVPGESSIQLLTFSAEDGSPTNVVTIPIPADGIWQLTVGG